MGAADLGSFEVVADRAEVALFRHTARLEGDTVPFTFPIRWLALPSVRSAAMRLVPEADLVAFHESQSFYYARPLELDAIYRLTVSARRDRSPDRLVITGSLVRGDGCAVARIETVLRLLSSEQPA